jgi:beta-galactosidase
VVHNFMGFFTQFDHHALGRDLDATSWDSYPLGFLEQFWFSDEEKRAYLRQGHPDIAAFHHDLYRGCQKDGRWWVMEQQPGPVNWARFNPAPLPGMVRLWTLEAMAHGAELVSYFRWRQAPFAQEQMHAGLLRPDRVDDQGAHEARAAARDIATIGVAGAAPRSVALIFDYPNDWVTEIQPQGHGFSALRAAFEYYSALRKLGLDVDILSSEASLEGYAIVVVPCLPILTDGLVDRLGGFAGPVLIGPRSGSKTHDFAIPPDLPPGGLQGLLPLKVVRVESLRDGIVLEGEGFSVSRWLETIEAELTPELKLNSGQGIVFRSGQVRYCAAWPDARLLKMLIQQMAAEADLSLDALPEGVRMRRAGNVRFALNYGAAPAKLPIEPGHGFLVGEQTIPPAGVAVWSND